MLPNTPLQQTGRTSRLRTHVATYGGRQLSGKVVRWEAVFLWSAW